MKVLVVGSGAREHALAWKLGESPRVSELFVAPGNAGTAAIATNLPIAADDVHALADAAERHAIDLTVVGPEDPLARGIVDVFSQRGLSIVGPSAAAARIESSKSWAKEVMRAAGVPTAEARTFTDARAALAALETTTYPVVIKAAGLAAGKGVVVAPARAEAEEAIRAMLEREALGAAGHEILIEEFLEGEEASVLALTDGETVYSLIPARDYKRVGEGDTGPNTGGMGAYAPVPAIDAALAARIEAEILRPTIEELRSRGIPYRGVLYAGLMLTADGPKVVEFNCRLGDPETEVVLPLLASDLVDLLEAIARGRLGDVSPPAWHEGACVAVVLTSAGYPGSYPKGLLISGLADLPPSILAFHAGTARGAAGEVVSSGGRVVTLAARGETIAAARERVYAAVERVDFQGKQIRRDIAEREAR